MMRVIDLILTMTQQLGFASVWTERLLISILLHRASELVACSSEIVVSLERIEVLMRLVAGDAC